MDASEWAGPVGDVWAAEWQRTDRSFADLAPYLNAAALAAAIEIEAHTIVDIGCGAGATSLALAAALPAADITGIDISPDLTAVAATRAANVPNLRFATGPVETLLAGHAPVDLFVSRHGVMFFPDPAAAFATLRAAAAPAGRIVFSCFRAASLNPWASEIGAEIGVPLPPSDGYAPGPFAFADPAFVRPLLAAAGWGAIEATPVDYHYRAGAGPDPVADALDLLSRIGPTARALAAADPSARSGMLSRMATVLERYRSGDIVDFPAAAWLWSARQAAGETL